MLYEALLGKPPFPGTTVMDMILAHIQRDPPSASQADPRVPQPISDLVRSLMKKSPEDRPASAKAVMDVLGAF